MEKPDNGVFDFPVLYGLEKLASIDDRRGRLALYLDFIRQLAVEAPRAGWMISEVYLTDAEDLKALLINGQQTLQVHFGQKDFLPRFRNFLALLPEIQKSSDKLDSVDLRYRNQIVVDPQTPAPAAKPASFGPRGPKGLTEAWRAKDHFIVGLDLGSVKTCALVCKPNAEGKLEVAGLGVAESKGWRKGMIVNLDLTALAVKKAMEAAEAAAGVSIDSAYVGRGRRAHQGSEFPRGHHAGEDLPPRRAKWNGRTCGGSFRRPKASPCRRIASFCKCFRKNSCWMRQDGIRDPVGMVGARLEVNVHLVTASISALRTW